MYAAEFHSSSEVQCQSETLYVGFTQKNWFILMVI